MNNAKIVTIAVLSAGIMAALTPLCAEKLPPPPHQGNVKVRGMRRNALVWRVFSQLSEPERRKMQELQRNNPEAFTQKMRELADKYEQQENAWRNKMIALVDKYRKSTDKAEREKLKAEVVKMEKERFDKRLSSLAGMIAATKRRVALMEQELNKRKARSAEIIDARAEAILSGELPVAAPAHHHFPPRKGAGRPPRLPAKP